MAHNKSTEKRIRQALKRNARNSEIKSSIRTAAKKVVKTIDADSSNSQLISEYFKDFVKKIDTAARKGTIHQSTAARKKSRLAKRINSIAIS